jgi:hypothetical protein
MLLQYQITFILISKYPHYNIEVLLFQNPISKFQTSISTFRRYRRFFGNHDIEFSYVDIEVTVFDIEKNVDIVIFDIDLNVDIGGGKVPDVGVPCRGSHGSAHNGVGSETAAEHCRCRNLAPGPGRSLPGPETASDQGPGPGLGEQA